MAQLKEYKNRRLANIEMQRHSTNFDMNWNGGGLGEAGNPAKYVCNSGLKSSIFDPDLKPLAGAYDLCATSA